MVEVKFANPPLTEVIFGVVFNAPDFSSVHFGLYWENIREQFPLSPPDKPPLVSGSELFLTTVPPLRRVWFESQDKKQLIQLQADRFYYNWRKQEDSDDYPRFKRIYPRFLEEWSAFQEWWSSSIKSLLLPVQYELTYINQINKDFGWSNASDNHKIFTREGIGWNGFLGSPQVHNFALQFSLPDNAGVLFVNSNQSVSSIDGEPVMLLELTVRGFDANTGVEQWFDVAHEYVVNGFADLIQPSIQKAWGRDDKHID